MTLFIGVVAVGAPLLSSFPDAAAVNWLQGEPFALVVRRRVASNVMTALALLPAMLVLWLHLPRWIRHTHPRRWLEAGALTAALVTAAQFAVSPLVVRVGELPVTVHHPARARAPVPAVGGCQVRDGRREPVPAGDGVVSGAKRDRACRSTPTRPPRRPLC